MEYNRIITPPKSKFLKSGKVTLEPGEEVGEHITDKREELIICLKGKATIMVEGVENVLEEGKGFFIPEEKIHNIFNREDERLEYIFIVALFDPENSD